MELIFWWMPVLWAVLILAVATVAVLLRARRRNGEGQDSRPVAHSSRLTALPGYRRAMARYRALLAGLLAVAALLVVASVGLASRPAGREVVYAEQTTRDIVLCLDVSGSMIDYDAALVDVFRELSDGFDGERVSLVVFNASAVTYFPLTSDYRYIGDQLDEIAEQFASDDAEFFSGTFFGDGSSLVGDGLASCTQRFDTPDQERSRSIILATDNLVVGDPIFTLPDAAALAAERGVRVYGINPGDQNSREYLDEFAVQFEDAVEQTGGAYYALGDADAVPSIVEAIGSEQAVATRGAPQLITADQPALLVVTAFLALAALLALAWRVGR